MYKGTPFVNKYVKWREQERVDLFLSAGIKDIKPIMAKKMEHNDTIIINNSKK
jgi:hypothetical protein